MSSETSLRIARISSHCLKPGNQAYLELLYNGFGALYVLCSTDQGDA
jgi:hypothetical protein